MADIIGIDRCLSILNILFKKTKHQKYIPNKLIIAYVKDGRLGLKSKFGVYNYTSNNQDNLS